MTLFGGRMGQQWGIMGQQPEEETPRNGFWGGGEKFGARDGIAGILAVLGDAFAQQGGGRGGAVDNLSGNRLSAIAMAKRQQEQQQQQEALMQAAMRRGIDPDDMTLAQGGMDGLLPKPEQPAPLVRDTLAFQNMTPEQRASFAEMEALRNRQFITDAAGMPHQINATRAPDTLSDDEWNSAQPLGGGASNGTGGFPPRYRR